MIQIKILIKYENFVTILLSQIWGNEPRNIKCRTQLLECIKMVENIIKDGIEKGEIVNADPAVIASQIFSLTCSSLIYKLKNNEPINVQKIYTEFNKTIVEGLKAK